MSISNLSRRAGRNRFRQRRLALLAATCIGLGSVVTAWAAPATEEGADALRQALEQRLGRDMFDRGILSIAPGGDRYDVTIDLDKIPEKREELDGPLPVMTLHITPADDGTYRFVSDPVSFSSSTVPTADAAPSSSSSGHADNCVAEGTFNPTALYLSTFASHCDGISVKDHSPKDPVDLDIGKVALQWTGKAAGDDTADIEISAELPDIAGIFADKGSDGPDAANHFKVGRIHYDVMLQRVRARQIIDLVSLWLAEDAKNKAEDKDKAENQDKAEKQDRVENKAEPLSSAMREKIQAALPLWDNVHTEMGVENLSVEIPGMAVTVGHYGEKHSLSGVVKAAQYAVNFDVSGVEFSGGIAPDWLRQVIPSKLALGLDVADIDLEGMAEAALNSPDDGTSKLEDRLPALLLNGKARVAGNASVTSPAYDVEGHGEAPIDPKMQGTATLSATGFDAIMSTAGKLATKDTRAMLFGLALMKGLAKTGPDGRLTWDLAVDVPAKKVTVNGQVFNLPKK